MKMRSMIPWVIAGALAASTVWNLRLTHRLDELEAKLKSTAEHEPRLPVEILNELELTKEQCEQIRGCSMT